MFSKIQDAIVDIEYRFERWRMDVSVRWFQFNEARRDALFAERSCPELAAWDREQHRMYYAREYPNITPLGHKLLQAWHVGVFYRETAAYILTGKECLAWVEEMSQEVDEKLLSRSR